MSAGAVWRRCQRCLNWSRTTAARCPNCGQFYWEVVDGRLLDGNPKALSDAIDDSGEPE